MATLSPNRIGIVFGLLLGGFHLLWAGVVAAAWAQSLLDFVFWIHFIRPVYVVEEFGLGRAVLLIALTSAIGYVAGICMALIWNGLQPSRRASGH